jgi:hypothetical protein
VRRKGRGGEGEKGRKSGNAKNNEAERRTAACYVT